MSSAADMLSPHFMRRELTCRCCGRIGPNPTGLNELLACLESLRGLAGKPVHIHCAYRCKAHNAAVGGVPDSYHMQDMAADFSVEGLGVNDLALLAQQAGFTGIGKYREQGFVHGDTGPRRTWEE